MHNDTSGILPKGRSVQIQEKDGRNVEKSGISKKQAGPKTQIQPGQKIGRLTVIGITGKDKQWKTLWSFRCECGKITIRTLYDLRRAKYPSCGCATGEICVRRLRTHGMSHTTEHNIWLSMRARCYNANSQFYHRYGGRGIKVCQRWIDSFENFISDMGRLPCKTFSIDRINNDGDYTPENCRWASKSEQGNNRSTSVRFLLEGGSYTIKQLSDKFHIRYATLYARLVKLGWSLDRSISQS